MRPEFAVDSGADGGDGAFRIRGVEVAAARDSLQARLVVEAPEELLRRPDARGEAEARELPRHQVVIIGERGEDVTHRRGEAARHQGGANFGFLRA